MISKVLLIEGKLNSLKPKKTLFRFYAVVEADETVFAFANGQSTLWVIVKFVPDNDGAYFADFIVVGRGTFESPRTWPRGWNSSRNLVDKWKFEHVWLAAGLVIVLTCHWPPHHNLLFTKSLRLIRTQDNSWQSTHMFQLAYRFHHSDRGSRAPFARLQATKVFIIPSTSHLGRPKTTAANFCFVVAFSLDLLMSARRGRVIDFGFRYSKFAAARGGIQNRFPLFGF